MCSRSMPDRHLHGWLCHGWDILPNLQQHRSPLFHPAPLGSIKQVLAFNLSLSQFLLQVDNTGFRASDHLSSIGLPFCVGSVTSNGSARKLTVRRCDVIAEFRRVQSTPFFEVRITPLQPTIEDLVLSAHLNRVRSLNVNVGP